MKIKALLSLAAIAATAACGSTPANSPSGVPARGDPAASPSGAPPRGGTAPTPVNPVPEVTGPSVRVVIDGVNQPTAFCGQSRAGNGSPCTGSNGAYEDGHMPRAQVFCGDTWGNGPPGPLENPTPTYAITWGDPPTMAGYKGPSDPGNVAVSGLSEGKSLSEILFFKSDLSKPVVVSLSVPDREYLYNIDNNGKPSPGPDPVVTHVGQSWHITGHIEGQTLDEEAGGMPIWTDHNPVFPFEVTVTCP